MPKPWKTALFVVLVGIGTAHAQEKPVIGLIPKAQKPITMDGKLDDWDGAFVTPVHVGHPDFCQPGRAVPLPVGRAESLRRLALPRPKARSRRPGQPNLERRCRRALPGHPTWGKARCCGVRPWQSPLLLDAVHQDRDQATDSGPAITCIQGFQAPGCRGCRRENALGLDRRVQVAVGQLPEVQGEGRRDHRHRLRTVQQ